MTSITASRPDGVDTSMGRVPELDLLRFIAAGSVVAYHFLYGAGLPGSGEFRFAAVRDVTRFGYLGVTLFFMISGFVILWSSQARTAGEFVVSRIARLFPSFWICVLITALVVNVSGAPDMVSLRTLVFNLTMVPGVFGEPYVDGVYWTLFVELKFYVLIFLVLITGTMHRVEAWLGVWLAATVLCATGLAPRGLASIALYPYSPYFISGCVFFLIRSRGVSLWRAVMLAVACVLGAQYAVSQQSGFMKEVTSLSGVVVASLVVIFHLIFLAIVFIPRILSPSRWWYILGSLTYPLYLLHNRIGKVIWAELSPTIAPGLVVAVQLVVSVGLAWLLAALVERHVCGVFQKKLLKAGIRFNLVRSVVKA